MDEVKPYMDEVKPYTVYELWLCMNSILFVAMDLMYELCVWTLDFVCMDFVCMDYVYGWLCMSYLLCI